MATFRPVSWLPEALGCEGGCEKNRTVSRDWGNYLLHDRDELASFVLRNKARIEAIARRKLRPAARTSYGSEDVLSTVLRRLDALAERGLVRAQSEAQLWALINSIAENVSLHRSRLLESLRVRSGDDADFWQAMHADMRQTREDEDAFVRIYELLAMLDDQDQRQMFMMRLRGAGHRVIAQHLGISEDAARQRWSLIVRRLRISMRSDEDAT